MKKENILNISKVFCFLAVINLLLSGHYYEKFIKERSFLKGIVEAVTYNKQTNKQKIKVMVNWIYEHNKVVSKKNKCAAYNLKCWPHFNPLWKFLKAPPEIVIKLGGHCGNNTRLLINILDVIGITAYRWHLWYPKEKVDKYCKEHNLKTCDQYGHAVVEVVLKNGEHMVLDPTFDVVYPYSMKKLNENPELIWKYVPENYDKFYTYEEARGIRWEIIGGKSDPLYKILTKYFDKNTINNLHYPYLLDRPYLFLTVFHLILAGIFFIVYKKVRK